ncbi:MAG TPA: hypothetical protein ENG70_01785 [Candidatus Cloacimonetes bacterium]|nr:hypothetical protein [Candidatus Cloacimonadota bacterium]HEX37581.1 hypothetical protein [Candidatus Cloacimonadota bacterium]
MKKVCIPLFAVMILLVSTLYASDVQIEDFSPNEKTFGCIESDLYTTTLQFTLPEFEIQEIHEKSEVYSKVKLFNEGAQLIEGLPDVPSVSRLIAIPTTGSVEVEVNYFEDEIMHNIQIYPYQGEDRSIEKFKKSEKYYTGSIPFPEQIVSVSEPQIFRDIRLVNVTINPFQYYPDKQELRIIKSAEVLVTTSSNSAANEKTRERKISRFFEPMYKTMIVNYDETFRDVEYQQPSYLFIYPNDAQVAATIQYVIDWKHQKGFFVTGTDTGHTGTSSSAIKSFIENAYYNWANPPEFVVLVGDAGGSFSIPTGHYSGGEGDHYYTTIEGGDILADIIIGRLSFNSILELQTIVSKILNYEKTPYMSNTSWYKKALLVGDPSTSGMSCVFTCQYVKEAIEDYSSDFIFDEIYNSPFVSGIANSINNGVSYFHYRGYYGMSGWDNNDIYNLNNGYMLPFAVFPTCGTGSFEGSGACRSEAFLRAGYPTAPKGAIAAYGTATLSTHTTFNNCVSGGSFGAIFTDNIFNPGGALTRAKLSLFNSYPANPSNWVNCFSYWNTLMGDPGIELWTGVPIELEVTHPTTVPLGSNYIEIHVDNEFGFAQQNAWVTILSDGDEIFESGYTDTHGNVVLPITPGFTGEISITVTKHNHVPYISSFSIQQSDSFASFDHFVVDDDNSGTSFGNGDGFINPGEDIEFQVEIKNWGTGNLSNVMGELSTDNTSVTISDSVEDFGDIPYATSVFCVDDFDFSVEPSALGGTQVWFELEISDDDTHVWNDLIPIIIDGANLDFEDITIMDGNNGILDPGETADVIVTLKNAGTVTAYNIQGVLTSSDDKIIVEDDTGTWGPIYPDDMASNNSNTFEVTADFQIIPGSQYYLQLHLTNPSGYDEYVSVLLEVGSVDIGDPLGPDPYGYYCYDSGDTDYTIAPVYTWIEIDPNYGGNGTVLSLSDYGDTGDIADLTLPFNITFYGRMYETITVCTNGWLAPGGSEQASFMNRPIPEAGGPSPMIAAFWDDLTTQSGGRVCYYYNPSSHYYVVEWSRMKNDYNNATETFQVIIYDSAYYPTPTGDSEILVQYKTVNNVNAGYYSGGYIHHGEYATVGLEDPDGISGLEYTFSNNYPTAARILDDEMALLFTTRGAEVLDPPSANISPMMFNFEIEQGQTGTDILEISNSGESNLIFSIDKEYQNSRDSGGPDAYGYMWVDSNDPGGPDFEWVDISAVGTSVSFTHNDHAAGPYNIGFDFKFYGETYDEFIINPNGWIGFGSDWTDWHNYSIPRADAPRPAIFGFWDDLDPIQGGEVSYYTNGIDSLVIWFDDVIHYPGQQNGTYNFQIIITENGGIKYQYDSVSGDTDSATIGIQNANGSIALEVAYNEYYVQNNLAVEFYRVIDWCSVEPSNGIVFPLDSQEITIQVDTEDLDYGETYYCDLYLTTNDPNHSLEIIPIALTVGDLDYGTVEGIVELIGGSATPDNVIITVGANLIFPDELGFFSSQIPVGTYTFSAQCNGYDPFIEQIEIYVDQTTYIDPILEFVEAPENIWAEISEEYKALIRWNDVNSLKKGRLFQSYTLLYRVNDGDWEELVSGLNDTTYVHDLFAMPDADYKYGVKAVYENSESQITETDVITIFRFVDTRFEFSLSNGASPEEIQFSLTGLDTIYTQVFEEITPPSGVLTFDDVFMSDYHLVAEKIGYETIDEIITISSDTTEFEYTLQYITATGDQPIPLVNKIEQNYPNPFHVIDGESVSTQISYHVAKPANITIEIFNIKGEKVKILINEHVDPGIYTVAWNGLDSNKKAMSSGIYFYRMLIDGKPYESKKCILIR